MSVHKLTKEFSNKVIVNKPCPSKEALIVSLMQPRKESNEGDFNKVTSNSNFMPCKISKQTKKNNQSLATKHPKLIFRFKDYMKQTDRIDKDYMKHHPRNKPNTTYNSNYITSKINLFHPSHSQQSKQSLSLSINKK